MTMMNEPATVDVDKLMAFMFKAVDELGATLNSALVVLGDKLGLYHAMAGAGALITDELHPRARGPRKSAWLSGPGPRRPASERSSPTPGSVGSRRWHQRRSTAYTRPGHDMEGPGR